MSIVNMFVEETFLFPESSMHVTFQECDPVVREVMVKLVPVPFGVGIFVWFTPSSSVRLQSNDVSILSETVQLKLRLMFVVLSPPFGRISVGEVGAVESTVKNRVADVLMFPVPSAQVTFQV